MNPDLLAYIRENRTLYTRDAISRHLAGAGHAPDDVEAAWAAVEAEAVPPIISPPDGADESDLAADIARPTGPVRRSVWREPLYWLTAIGFVVAYLGGSALLITLVSDNFTFAGGFILLTPLAAGVISVVLLATNRARSVAWGLLAGLGLTILLAFIAVVIIAGICIAYIVQTNNP